MKEWGWDPREGVAWAVDDPALHGGEPHIITGSLEPFRADHMVLIASMMSTADDDIAPKLAEAFRSDAARYQSACFPLDGEPAPMEKEISEPRGLRPVVRRVIETYNSQERLEGLLAGSGVHVRASLDRGCAGAARPRMVASTEDACWSSAPLEGGARWLDLALDAGCREVLGDEAADALQEAALSARLGRGTRVVGRPPAARVRLDRDGHAEVTCASRVMDAKGEHWSLRRAEIDAAGSELADVARDIAAQRGGQEEAARIARLAGGSIRIVCGQDPEGVLASMGIDVSAWPGVAAEGRALGYVTLPVSERAQAKLLACACALRGRELGRFDTLEAALASDAATRPLADWNSRAEAARRSARRGPEAVSETKRREKTSARRR